MTSTYFPTEHNVDWATAPGSVLQRELDARGISQAQLAARSGLSTKHINLVIKGHAAISADVAVTLEQVLEVPAETWLRIEAKHQAHHARLARDLTLDHLAEWVSEFPMTDLVERSIVARDDTIATIAKKLLRFFGVASPAAFTKTWLEPQASYKRAQKFTIDRYAIAVWLRLSEVEATKVVATAPQYDPRALEAAVKPIANATIKPLLAAFEEAQRILLSAGVALVYVPEIKATRINGVSRWVQGHPTIALTSRYRYLDVFWFTLMHEIGHVLLHPKRGTYVDYTGKADDDADSQEAAANTFAESALLPREYRAQVASATTAETIIQIAASVGVDPGIIAGQHGHLAGKWNGPIGRLRVRGDLEDAARVTN
ncbi:helix-turn-helix domain-containing protein [uncultured Amnibacterium sp.]|uniref:helix-turn-helix domain-containing protein n=1 Tax=uncultured Amnibacterium sp. TaxID=1631851 RepID=UPI0035CB3C13